VLRVRRVCGTGVLVFTLAAALALATAASSGCVARGGGWGTRLSDLGSVRAAPSKVPSSALESTTGLPTESRPKTSVSIPGTKTPSTPGGGTGSGFTADSGPAFSSTLAMRHVRYLADTIGVRQAGSSAEKRAADYITGQLSALGYEPRIETFQLPNGKTSRNVVAEKQGASTWAFTLGAHVDSKVPSPGANDNASGCGALLAMAAALADSPARASVQFVFFGSEEMIGSDPDVHHLGSRFRVSRMTAAEKAQTAGMLSVDMIGRGDELYIRNMHRGSQALVSDFQAYARSRLPLTYKKDPGASGWSDHEAYELAGVPVGWIESLPDSKYHTTGDVGSRVQASRLQHVGQLILSYVWSLSDADLAELRR
jgi:hypothetical protein